MVVGTRNWESGPTTGMNPVTLTWYRILKGEILYGDFPRVTLGGAVWEVLWESAEAIPTKTPFVHR